MKKEKSENHPKKKVNKGCIKPIILFLSLFILPGLGFGLYSTFQTIKIQSWVEVEATIDSTFYKNKTFTKRRKIGKTSKRKSYTAGQTRVKYTYQWEGKTYHSNRVALWQSNTKDDKRNKELKMFLDKAKTVKAFVNPKAPKEALLVKSIHNGILFFYVSAFSCFFFFGAISGLFFKLPHFKFGVVCLIGIIILYAWFFGWGGIYLIDCIEVLS